MKTAVITGATGGIGTALTRRYAAEGYQVVAAYYQNKSAAQQLRQLGQVTPLCLNLAEYDQIQAFSQRVLELLGHVDVLVNNAGISRGIGLFQSMEQETTSRLYAVNLMGTLELSRALLPSMLSRHSGCIVNLSSMWGEVGASCEVDYSAAKGAVLAFTRALAKEVGPSGIRVNCVSPGLIETPMNRGLDAETRRDLIEETPLRRIGRPEDVANAVFWLSSDQASFITGQDLPVNGGYVIG